MPLSRRTKSSSSFPRTFIIAGYSILTYGIYSLIVALSRYGLGPEQMLLRIGQSVSAFPLLFLGVVLIILGKTYFGRPNKRTRTHLYTLVVFLSSLFSILYFLFIPLTFISMNSILTADNNSLNRVMSTINSRKKEILESLETANSKDQIVQSLRNFPEISNIDLSDTSDLKKIKAGVSDTLDMAIKSQSEKIKQRFDEKHKSILSSSFSSALACLISALAFSGITSEIFPLFRRFFVMFMSPFSLIWKPLISGMGLDEIQTYDTSPASNHDSTKSHLRNSSSESSSHSSSKSQGKNSSNSQDHR